ncbi:MAG: tyrosine-type recombinase/integrase [Alphaproteobacteria bacterium]|nr:tyrosine-type recombinase/integrase [Alphaproteobacteria bacterium]
MKNDLTKTLIEALQPAEKEYAVWDKKQTGFGIKITPKGKRVYICKYRLPSRKQGKYTIGTHGQITLQQARKLAGDIFAQVRFGKNPMAEKNLYKTALTVSQLCDKYIKEHAEIHKKPSSVYDDNKYIKAHIRPKLGHIYVRDITKHDIEKLHLSLKKTPVLANHVRAVLSKMFALAEKWGIREEGTNPVRHIKKYAEKPRERYLSREEGKRLLNTLNEMETDNTECPYALALIRLLWMTGARGSEIRTAKWEWVDFERKTIELPDSKTGRRTIHLNNPVIAILKKLPRIENTPYLLPSPIFKNKPLAYPRKTWDAVRENAGLQDFRMHDLRHSYASTGIEAGLSLSEIGKLLGHTQMHTTQRYAHMADIQAKRASDTIGKRFSAGLEQKASATNDH